MLTDGLRAAAYTRLWPTHARVPRLVSGLALAAACLLSTISTPVPVARAAGSCTGWTNNVSPPSSIRVLRTSGPAAGSVQTVNFRQYVNTVIAAEWSPGPVEAMRAGAIAVKQYAWYWTIVWRGHSAADGSCYDVVDTTQDQIYRPETMHPAQALLDAIDSTWPMSIRRDGRLFSTGYRTGSASGCGSDVDGNILYQASLYACARGGELLDQLLHRYLDPVEIVRPGAGDSTGDGLGDVAVVTPGVDATNVRLYGAGRVTAPAPIVTTALGIPVALPVAPALTIFRQLADVTGDHLDDLLLLQRLGDGHYQIWVSPATGSGFGPPELWWESTLSNIAFAPGALVRFAAGDFTGDGRPDVALLVASDPVPPSTGVPSPSPSPLPEPTPSASPTPTPIPTATPTPSPTVTPTPSPTPTPTAVVVAVPNDPFHVVTSIAKGATVLADPGIQPDLVPGATLWILPGTGSAFGAATLTWVGPLQLDGTTVFGGDVDNDGHADIVIQMDMTKQPQPSVGIREVVLRLSTPIGSAPETWLDLPDIAASNAKTVIADLNRDGRADLVVDRTLGATGSQFLGLLSSGSGFQSRVLWSNSGSFRWAASRIASADVDGDGRGDIVVLYNAGSAGSRLYRFLSTGTALRSSGATTDGTLPWAGAAPY